MCRRRGSGGGPQGGLLLISQWPDEKGWLHPADHDDPRSIARDHPCSCTSTGRRRRTTLVSEAVWAVFHKFFAYAPAQGLANGGGVGSRVLNVYSNHLEAECHAYRTQYVELTTLKQAVPWMVTQGRPPSDSKIDLPLGRVPGTNTNCWKAEEVLAMIEHCRSQEQLSWLGKVIRALATTGTRISEIAGLRWSHIELQNWMVRLVDETSSGRQGGKGRRTL